jgi:hypothetical protein
VCFSEFFFLLVLRILAPKFLDIGVFNFCSSWKKNLLGKVLTEESGHT